MECKLVFFFFKQQKKVNEKKNIKKIKSKLNDFANGFQGMERKKVQ